MTLAVLGNTAVMALVGAAAAQAHDGTGDAIALSLDDRRVAATAPVLFSELGLEDTSGDGLVDTAEIRAQQPEVAATLVETVREHVSLRVDGEEVEVVAAGLASPSGADAAAYVPIVFFSGPHDGDVSEVTATWTFTSPSEQVLLSSAAAVVAGELGEGGTASFSLDTGSTVRSFLVNGVDHIRLGLDHLLFLVVLTVAVVGTSVSRSSLRRVVGLVTAFTLGHATSLVLAYLDVVSVPAALVEPLISLSIVVAAVLAIRGRGAGVRAWLVGAIGLVHGLGFASSLDGMGVATVHQVSALAAFNVGIDLAQTAVVLAVCLGLWAAGQLPVRSQGWARVMLCVPAAVIGSYWTVAQLAG